MNWAGITYVLLILLSTVLIVVQHGKPRQPHDARVGILGLILTLFLMWQAGWLE